jgi:hypothetical protein
MYIEKVFLSKLLPTAKNPFFLLLVLTLDSRLEWNYLRKTTFFSFSCMKKFYGLKLLKFDTHISPALSLPLTYNHPTSSASLSLEMDKLLTSLARLCETTLA